MSPPKPAVLALDEVALTYDGPPPVAALRSTTLRILSGEYIAITGPSGSGKSTLLSVMGLLEPPTSGTIRIGDTNVAGLRAKALAELRARTFGFVFQRFHLMPAITALSNVEIALMYQGVRSSDRTAAAQAALERVGLGHRMGHRPSEMSGGEQQRVAIARAIACEQPCLLADEPTGNLDSATTESILDLLDQIAVSGTTVICVTHSDEVSRRATRRLRVKDGIVHADPPRSP